MGKRIEQLTPELITFIGNQKMFFVATAMEQGRINLSPKGMDTFRVIDNNRVLWLNLTGSGNETATHLQHSDRITIMFCAFEGNPLILRLYGNAKVFHNSDPEWEEYSDQFPKMLGSRQIIEIEINLVQTSCGYSIPFMDFKKERDGLIKWSDKKGSEGIKNYQKEKNTTSLDGLTTGLPILD